MNPIPFNRPCTIGLDQRTFRSIRENIHLSGDGPFTRWCQRRMEEQLGVRKVLLTHSCTAALEMAALLLDLQPGDEVIVPAFTFCSTANAFVLRGAKPVFVDIRPDTLNLDERLLEEGITVRTRAIVPVHYGGVGCEMDVIGKIARKHGVPVVEDNAHGLFGKYRGQLLGTFGCLATQSFHETKNISCGEGGALLINRRRYELRAEVLREKGTNRSQFFRGQVNKYSWIDIGSSFLPSDIVAGVLRRQLERHETIQAKRRRLWETYLAGLNDWSVRHRVGLPHVPAHCEQAYHLFYLIMPSLRDRQELISHLKARGIMAVFHYLPLNLSPMGRKWGGRRGQCPVTERISDRLLRLPFFYDLKAGDQARVIDAVREFTPRAAAAPASPQ